MKNDSCLNEAQRIVLKTYANGDYAHEIDAIDNPVFRTSRQVMDTFLENCGDTLLAFLLTELSDTEDCEDMETALGRIDTAFRQLKEVKDALLSARLEGAL
jgi:hypothetical protein